MVDSGIIRRVACAKYLFIQGVAALGAGGPFSSGIAVLAFQDAAEMLLGAIAEHIHAAVKEQIAFAPLLDAIDQAGDLKLTHRSALIQMNRARVNFKHHGLEPKDEDASKFRATLEVFFPASVTGFLGIDYERITLAELILHTRTRNWVREAEEHFNASKYADCLFCTAVALELAVKRKTRGPSGESVTRHAQYIPGGNDFSGVKALVETAEAIEERFRMVDQHLYLIGSGVKYADLQRFRDLVPPILFTGDQTPHGNFAHGMDFSEEQAQFCISFVQDTVLKIQKQYSIRERWGSHKPKGMLKALRDTPVIVYPTGPKRQREVLFELIAGSTVPGYPARGGEKTGFNQVLFEDDVAYIASQDVEVVGEGE